MSEEQKEIRRQRERDRRASKSPIKQSLVQSEQLENAILEVQRWPPSDKAELEKRLRRILSILDA